MGLVGKPRGKTKFGVMHSKLGLLRVPRASFRKPERSNWECPHAFQLHIDRTGHGSCSDPSTLLLGDKLPGPIELMPNLGEGRLDCLGEGNCKAHATLDTYDMANAILKYAKS